MKKIIASLFLSTSLLTGCGQVDTTELNNGLVNTESNYSASSKNSRGIFSIIEKNNAEYKKRNPEIIKLKYQAMSESAFAFYRATAYLFYMDIANNDLKNGINVPLQGDLHLENIGTYFAANGKVYYDLNDFDDAFTGSYTLDVTRFLTSIYLAANEAGFDKTDSEELAEEFLDEYKDSHEFFLANKNAVNQPFTQLNKPAQKAVDKTIANNYQSFLSSISANDKFIYSDKIKQISPETFNNVSQGIKNYISTKIKSPQAAKIKDIGAYIAGKGSLGRYRYIALLEGGTTKSADDLVLDIKEAGLPSSSIIARSSGNNAQRITQATKYFLSYPDPYLATTNIGDLSFYIRKIGPDEKVNLKKLDKKSDFKDHMKTVAAIIAKSHAKSGKSLDILNDFKEKKESINDFAKNYSKQVVNDYDEFKKSF